MIFLVLLEKMIFVFPENMILPLRRKMKENLSQKNAWKYDIFFGCSKKMVFFKKIALEHDLFCITYIYIYIYILGKKDLNLQIHKGTKN